MKKFFYGFIFLFVLFILGACHQQLNEVDKEISDSKTVHNKNEDESTEKVEHDYPPMVMIDGQLYQDMGYINSAVKCGTPDGEIISSVDGTKLPEQNNESNFGTGYEYQLYDKAHVQVNIDGKWVIFQNIAISSREIPKSVANFKAKVIEASEDRLLVAVTEISDEFKWIFEYEDIEKIKPISLTIENLELNDHKKETDLKNLTDSKIQVWFDGSIKNSEPESSVPIYLGGIYKIIQIEE